MEPMKQQRVRFTDVARMNATRTTPPHRPAYISEEEQKKPANPVKLTACEIISVAYMAAGVFLALRLDIVERWWQLLVVIDFCILVGGFFGIMASVERYAEEIEGGEER